MTNQKLKGMLLMTCAATALLVLTPSFLDKAKDDLSGMFIQALNICKFTTGRITERLQRPQSTEQTPYCVPSLLLIQYSGHKTLVKFKQFLGLLKYMGCIYQRLSYILCIHFIHSLSEEGSFRLRSVPDYPWRSQYMSQEEYVGPIVRGFEPWADRDTRKFIRPDEDTVLTGEQVCRHLSQQTQIVVDFQARELASVRTADCSAGFKSIV